MTATLREPKGTVQYMSPEQLDHDEVVDHRTDLWSLGVTLHVCLSEGGAFPFASRSASRHEAAEAIKTGEAAPLSSAEPELAVIVRRAMVKDREARYQSATAMVADVRSSVGYLPCFWDGGRLMNFVMLLRETIGNGDIAQAQACLLPPPAAADGSPVPGALPDSA